MSLQLHIRFEENQPENDYETNLLSRAFELLESLQTEAEGTNFLALPYTTNEEDIDEEIEEAIGEEPEDPDDFDDYEEQMEVERGRRGDFFAVADLTAIVDAWLGFFAGRGDEEFRLDARRTTLASDMAVDLQNVLDTLALAKDGRARFVIG